MTQIATPRRAWALHCPDCRRQLIEGECQVHPAIVLEPPGPDDDAHDPSVPAPDPWLLCGGDPRAA